MEPLVILGSSQSEGATKQAIELGMGDCKYSFIDLKKHQISYFDYDHHNQGDDFLKIAEKMIEHPALVFATPVYWYAMSAQLKTFFDRLSDLITIRKDLGRALKGKHCFLIATGFDLELPEGFEVPFRRTAAYFDMTYHEALYYYNGKDPTRLEENAKRVDSFSKLLSSVLAI